MEGRPPVDRTSIRIVAGLTGIAVLLSAILATVLATETRDPDGMATAAPLAASDVARIEPLYGAIWTPYGSLDWSPDGRWLALAGRLGTEVVIVDARTGVAARSWEIPGASIVRWSPDGTELAVGIGSFFAPNPGAVYLYSASGSRIRSWQAEAWLLGGLAWSPDGSLLVTAAMDRYHIWDAQTGTLVRGASNTTIGEGVDGPSVDWSPDGRLLAFEAEGGPVVYNASSGGLAWRAGSNGTSDFRDVAWSHSGDRLAASNSHGCLDIFSNAGRYLGGYNQTYDGASSCSDGWLRRPSWNPADTLIAVPTPGGIRIFDASTAAPLRTLIFPVDNYGESSQIDTYGPGTSRDMDAEWSPSGNALASTGSMTNPSLRMWGLRGRGLALWSVLFDAGLVAGLPLVFGLPFLALLRRPEAFLDGPLRRTPPFAPGLGMLALWFVFAAVQQSLFSLGGRVYGAQVVPPASWFVWNLAASLGFSVVPAVAGVLTFAGVTWRSHGNRAGPVRRVAFRILAWALVPIVWFLALGDLVLDLTALAGVGTDPLASSGVVAVFGGVGACVAASALTRVPGTTLQRAFAGLLSATAASLFALFVGFFLLFEVLSTFRVALPGVWGVYGLFLNFGFGLAPWFASLILLVVLGAGYAVLAAPPRFLLPLFARLRREDIADQTSRRRVLTFLRDHPGAHFRELMRELPMGNGSLHYHLYVLEREGFVVARRDGMYRRFFPSDWAVRSAMPP